MMRQKPKMKSLHRRIDIPLNHIYGTTANTNAILESVYDVFAKHNAAMIEDFSRKYENAS